MSFVAGRRMFSAGCLLRSNIGSAPILVPAGTTLEIQNKVLDEVAALRLSLDKMRNGKPKIHVTKSLLVKGPKGTVNLGLADFVNVEDKDGRLSVSVEDPTQKHQRAMWGTSRSLVSNSVVGVNEGHMTIVKLVGTGFRATLEKTRDGQSQLNLRVGYSTPRIVKVPAELSVDVPVPHRIVISGCDLQQVKLLAAEVRKHRKPEPYKGKGIFIDDETIKLKQKKIK